MSSNGTIVRQSNFELLRLVSMFFIVFYHLLRFFVVRMDDAAIYKAMYLPLHVAVICFVLISGYFHIKPSFRGAVKLLAPLVIFYLPLTLWEYYHGVGEAKSLLVFSKSPYWFIRAYFCLFLMSPMLNNYLTDNKRRLQMLLILGFIAVYMGSVHEPSLKGGKNVALFMFVYVLGDCLNAFKSKYERWRPAWIILAYLILNVLEVVCYVFFHDSLLGKVLWVIAYPYCAPLLIMNAVLLFVIFSKFNFRSKAVNWLSLSVFSVYVLHHQHFILYSLIGPCVLYNHTVAHDPLILLTLLGGLTLLIMLTCMVVDKLCSPIWNFLSVKANKLESLIVFRWNQTNNRSSSE